MLFDEVFVVISENCTKETNRAVGMAQSVYPLATGLTVRGSNPRGGGGPRFFLSFLFSADVHPASFAMRTGSCPGSDRPERGADHTASFSP